MDFRTCEEGKELSARPLDTERQSDRGQLFDAVQPQLDTKVHTSIKTGLHNCEENLLNIRNR